MTFGTPRLTFHESRITSLNPLDQLRRRSQHQVCTHTVQLVLLAKSTEHPYRPCTGPTSRQYVHGRIPDHDAGFRGQAQRRGGKVHRLRVRLQTTGALTSHDDLKEILQRMLRKESLSRHCRAAVLSKAETLYVAA